FFFQAEDGIRDFHVTGVQTCALPMLIETRMVVSTMRMTGLFWEMHSPDTFSDSHTEQSGRVLTFHSFYKVLEAGRSGFAVKSLKRFTTATKGLYSIVIWTGGRLLTQMQPIRG